MTQGISYDSSTKTYVVKTSAQTADIQTIIDAAGAGSTILFSSGEHHLTQQLQIRHGDISVKGMGEGQTTLVIEPNGLRLDGIMIRGGNVDWNGTVSGNVTAGTHTLTLASTTGLHAGDVLHVYEANTSAFMHSGLYDNIINSGYVKDNPLRESLVEIESINGNVVTLKHAVAYDMDGGLAKVERVPVLDNVRLSDFSVTYDLPGTPDAESFTNTHLELDNTSAISIGMTRGVEVDNITIFNAASHGLELRGSLEAHVDGLTVNGAWNKGGEGNGYALHLAETFYGTFENLTLVNTRHAVVFSSWNAEAYNTVDVDYTNRDINFHGSPDHSNTVIVQEMEYRGGNQSWSPVSTGSEIHPYTDVDQNMVSFGFVTGSEKDDRMSALDSGGTLYGRAGDDTLIGGKGADFLQGGEGNDNLYGNGGSDVLYGGIGEDEMDGGGGTDRFVRFYGDGADTISGFEAGTGRDTIDLRGYYGVQSFADLNLVQSGSDTEIILHRSGSFVDMLTLHDVQVNDLRAGNFLFHDDQPTESVTVVLSTVSDYVRGSDGADSLTAKISALNAGDNVDLGAGQDVLVMDTTSFTLDTSILSGFRGLDAIDARNTTGAKFVLDDGIIDRTDSGTLTLLSGANGIERLDTSAVSGAHEVTISGSGLVTLANVMGNVLTLSDLFKGSVSGGKYDDSFTLRGGGMSLDAGAGDDYFVVRSALDALTTMKGGEGNDLFSFVVDGLGSSVRVQGGSGFDELRFTPAVNVTLDDMAGVSGIERLSFKSAGSFVALTDKMFGAQALEIRGHDDLVGMRVDVSDLKEAHVVELGKSANLTVSGTHDGNVQFVISEDATGYLSASASADVITGSTHADRILGNAGDDKITGGGGKDTLTGGAGRDTFFLTFGDGSDTITDFQTGSGGDKVDMTGFYQFRNFGEIRDAMVQEGLNTRLMLGAKETLLFKNTEIADFRAENFSVNNAVVMDVTVRTSSGADRIITGAGSDTVNVWTSNLSSDDIFDLGAGTDMLQIRSTGNYTFDSTLFSTIRGIEILDVCTTTGTPELILSDAMVDGSDTDRLLVLFGANGLSLNTGDVGEAHDVTLRGGGTVRLADGANNRVSIDANQTLIVAGGTGDDYIRIRGGDVTASGGAGDDIFSVTGSGHFVLNGGAGNDVFQMSNTGGAAGQTIQGGSGFDDLRLYDSANLTRSDLSHVTGIDRIRLYEDANSLDIGETVFDGRLEIEGDGSRHDVWINISDFDPGDTLVIGGNLDVTLSGYAGSTYRIETTSATNGSVYGTEGNDLFTGGSAADRLYGMDGMDVLLGGNGNDRLDGGNGDDILTGGRGADVLTGGLGNDTFVYTHMNEIGDIITDFGHSSGDRDTVDLTALFDANKLGALDTAGAFAQGFLSLRQSGADVQLYVDLDGAAKVKHAETLVLTFDDVSLSHVAQSQIVV